MARVFTLCIYWAHQMVLISSLYILESERTNMKAALLPAVLRFKQAIR